MCKKLTPYIYIISLPLLVYRHVDRSGLTKSPVRFILFLFLFVYCIMLPALNEVSLKYFIGFVSNHVFKQFVECNTC
jgi:hypothetical protein